MDKTKVIYCSKCGAHLGEAVVGYMKTVQCFCGEVMTVDKTPIEIEYPNDTKPLFAY